MGQSRYRTAPWPTTTMPPGVPYIVGNEAAERFSFYGMRGILVTFMTKYLLDSYGRPAVMSDEQAKAYFHLFVAAAYLFPLAGGILADVWLGKYRTIISLSLVYCLGHLALAVDDTRMGLFLGLVLIAVGSGGIKPCVSAHVGDQFGRSNVHLQGQVFSWFYLAINLGAFVSNLLTPWLLDGLPAAIRQLGWEGDLAFLGPLDRLGPHVAFGVPGLLMLAATWVFWLGRNAFVHIPAQGPARFKSALKGTGGRALLKLLPIYVFVAVFWALYDQTGSAWVLQAEKMDRTIAGFTIRAAQVQAVNPLLILVLVPLFTYVIYPTVERFVPFSPLWRVAVGLGLTVAGFAIAAAAQAQIDAGGTPGITWQLAAYLVITAAEVMVSVTCLEFSYTQAPRELKSFVMSLYLLSVSLGNEFTSLVNWFIENPDGSVKLEGAAYYWFFTIVMLVAAVLFVPVAWFYRGQTYIQEEAPAETTAGSAAE